jgi:hypothetical protein
MFGRNVSKRFSRAVMFAFGIGVVFVMLSSAASAGPPDKRQSYARANARMEIQWFSLRPELGSLIAKLQISNDLAAQCSEF